MQYLPVRSDRRVRVVPSRNVVVVLHADDLCDGTRLGELLGRHVADPEMPDQALPPQLREDGERFRDRAGSGTLQTTDAQVDHVESLQPQMLEIVVHGAGQLFAGQGNGP